MSRSLKIDQIAEALVAAPGIHVQMLEKVPSGVFTLTTDTTWENIDDPASPSEFEQSFVVPVAGLYQITFNCAYFLDPIGSGDHLRWRLIIDEGTGDEQILGGDAYWEVPGSGSVVGDRNARSLHATVELSAGGHTIIPQWYAMGYGSGVPKVAGDGETFSVIGNLISGSGASGTIVTEDSLSSASAHSSTSWEAVSAGGNDLEVTVVCIDGEQVFFGGNFPVYPTTDNSNFLIGIGIDGANPTAGMTNMWGWASAAYTSDEFNPVTCSSEMSAGTHTFRLMCKRLSGGGTLTFKSDAEATTRLMAIQYRGGLVPIRQDGVDKVGQPRALNFIGAGVYEVSETNGVADIELNQAITAVGTRVVMIDTNTTPTTYSDDINWGDIPITGSPITFNIPVAGLYEITFVPSIFGSGGPSGGTFQLVFDFGETYAQTIGDDLTWHLQASADRHLSHVMKGQVELTAGNHTIKAQWKRMSGAYGGGSMGVDANSWYHVSGVLLSGSGAGGVLLTEVEDSTGDYTNSTTDYEEITGLEITDLDTSTEAVLVELSIHSYAPSAGHTLDWFYKIDSGSWVIINRQALQTINAIHPFNVAFPVVLSAGTHTIKFAYKNTAAEETRVRPGEQSIPIYSRVWRFRGGLVPIRNNSVNIVDKPAAIDFVGTNVQVVNNGGTAEVSLIGSGEGEIDANCLITDAVQDVVYITGDAVGGRIQVTKVDIDDDTKMPGIGIITSKSDDTICKVQTYGNMAGVYSGLTVRKQLWINTSSRLDTSPPADPVSGYRFIQPMGFTLASNIVLVNVSPPIKKVAT